MFLTLHRTVLNVIFYYFHFPDQIADMKSSRGGGGESLSGSLRYEDGELFFLFLFFLRRQRQRRLYIQRQETLSPDWPPVGHVLGVS